MCPGTQKRSSTLEYRKTRSVTLPAILRHQAEIKIAICTKPDAHPVHSMRAPGVRQVQKSNLKSLYSGILSEYLCAK